MGNIDQQHRDQVLRDTLKENENLKKEIKLLEKIIELNMKDFHIVVDQRDNYYKKLKKINKGV